MTDKMSASAAKALVWAVSMIATDSLTVPSAALMLWASIPLKASITSNVVRYLLLMVYLFTFLRSNTYFLLITLTSKDSATK